MRKIARSGKRLRAEHFDVRVVASLSCLPHARVGLVVPKHGRSAVDRNRLKRRLRELSRKLILPYAPGLDLVIHARPSAYRISHTELREIIERLLRQLTSLSTQLLRKSPSGNDGDIPPPDPPSLV